MNEYYCKEIIEAQEEIIEIYKKRGCSGAEDYCLSYDDEAHRIDFRMCCCCVRPRPEPTAPATWSDGADE